MKLDQEQTGILQGESGAVKAQALRTLIEYARMADEGVRVAVGSDLYENVREGKSVEIDGSSGDIRVW